MKILFITSTRIGDAVLSTSTLNYLKGKYPKSHFTIACGPLAAPLFEYVPGLEKLIVFNRKKFSYHWIDLWLRSLTTFWDLIVDLRGSALAYLLPTKARYVWRSYNSPHHRVTQLADLLKLKTVPSPTVWLGEASIAKANSLLPAGETYIGIGPAANWKGKEWPLENFQKIIEWMIAPQGLFSNATILFFAAPSEKERIQPLLRNLKPHKIKDLSGELELLEVAACLQKCTLYIGNDSGLMHLSAACGTPTIGLFGPSRANHYAPWGSHARAVLTDDSYEKLIKFNDSQESLMTTLPVSRVQEAIIDLIANKAQAQ